MSKRAFTHIRVTDHAIIRYLERAKNVDMQALREEIATKAQLGALLGASAVTCDGIKFVLEPDIKSGYCDEQVVAIPTVIKTMRFIAPKGIKKRAHRKKQLRS